MFWCSQASGEFLFLKQRIQFSRQTRNPLRFMNFWKCDAAKKNHTLRSNIKHKLVIPIMESIRYPTCGCQFHESTKNK